MNELLIEYWPWLVAALVAGLLIAWAVLRGTKRTRVTGTSTDVLDEGADRARRNAALIDAPPAAETLPLAVMTPQGLGGAGAAVAAAAEAASKEAAAAQEAAPPPEADAAGELTRLKGVGPKLAARLQELGVTTLAEIAAWDEAEIDRIDAGLGRFQGRIRQDDWPGQARLLLSGDNAAYQARYGARS